MKKFWKSIPKDLWIVILDIIAVNAAYFLALILRFYVNFEFRPTVSYYLTDWLHFTPFYTVLAIITFVVFKLYGGMWRYAGINDMNRIIGASLVTTIIQVVGTLIFIRRMPITYYVIGAILQFFFIVLIRFGYRILLVEKKKVADRRTPAVPCMVIGAGETARKAIHHLEDTPFRATIAIDEKSAGKTIDGVPIAANYVEMLSSVKAVFIADPELSAEKKREIRQKAEEQGIEFQDYTGYLNNLGGRIPVSSLLELAKGPVTLVAEGKEQSFNSGDEALQTLKERYEIQSIEGMKISLSKPNATAYVGYEAWAKQHKEETGEEVSFF